MWKRHKWAVESLLAEGIKLHDYPGQTITWISADLCCGVVCSTSPRAEHTSVSPQQLMTYSTDILVRFSNDCMICEVQWEQLKGKQSWTYIIYFKNPLLVLQPLIAVIHTATVCTVRMVCLVYKTYFACFRLVIIAQCFCFHHRHASGRISERQRDFLHLPFNQQQPVAWDCGPAAEGPSQLSGWVFFFC